VSAAEADGGPIGAAAGLAQPAVPGNAQVPTDLGHEAGTGCALASWRGPAGDEWGHAEPQRTRRNNPVRAAKAAEPSSERSQALRELIAEELERRRASQSLPPLCSAARISVARRDAEWQRARSRGRVGTEADSASSASCAALLASHSPMRPHAGWPVAPRSPGLRSTSGLCAPEVRFPRWPRRFLPIRGARLWFARFCPEACVPCRRAPSPTSGARGFDGQAPVLPRPGKSQTHPHPCALTRPGRGRAVAMQEPRWRGQRWRSR